MTQSFAVADSSLILAEVAVGEPVKAAPRNVSALWVLTLALLSVWAYGLMTANNMGGFVDVFLIAGAAMIFLTLVLGRRIIS